MRVGAIRMPARAARDAPMAQASMALTAGRAPFSIDSGRSSTEARMAMPMRVR